MWSCHVLHSWIGVHGPKSLHWGKKTDQLVRLTLAFSFKIWVMIRTAESNASLTDRSTWLKIKLDENEGLSEFYFFPSVMVFWNKSSWCEIWRLVLKYWLWHSSCMTINLDCTWLLWSLFLQERDCRFPWPHVPQLQIKLAIWKMEITQFIKVTEPTLHVVNFMKWCIRLRLGHSFHEIHDLENYSW